MQDDDPYSSGGDRTIMRPRPGGRRPAPAAAPAPAPPPPARYPPPPSYGTPQGYAPPPSRDATVYGQPAPSYGHRPEPPRPQPPPAASGGLPGALNPLTAAASTLLALIAELRESASHPDPAALFHHIGGELGQFEAAARAKGEPPDAILAARYMLCTVIDETVLNTPWGSQSVWASQTLLSHFHNETWGGERFFQSLNQYLQEPSRNLHMLELMYLCIALGFEGKYRIQERGRAELDRIQEHVYQTIRQQRGDFERALSPRWQGVQDKRPRLVRYVPLWVVAAVCAGLLVILYFGFLVAANRAAEPVLTAVAALGRGSQPAAPAAPRPPSADLRQFLQPQIADRTVEVNDVAQGQVVTMAGDGLFASGRAEVRAERMQLLLAIADALNRVPGGVRITGHTDNVPMSVFGRYKSNWDLSQARADAVLQVLATRVPGDRLSADGVAETQPVADNGTPEGRSRNRRVEITLLAQAGGK
ncbi:MAG TPA: type IVB secretion system protein IcmH/DotU [Gammaproteobacteria bacterium]|nr:type IVB secretion system protein IcmH/DotU [Gammaproteobacteria bacterium]